MIPGVKRLCLARRFYTRWKEWESWYSQSFGLHFSLREEQWQEDWAFILSLASQVGRGAQDPGRRAQGLAPHVGASRPLFSSLLHSQDPVWSKPTFLSWRTSFAGPSSSTESSITRVSVARLWATPVFKVSGPWAAHAPVSREEPAWERCLHRSHLWNT